MGSLDQKVAVVTGASRGIGRAIAEKLAGDGARVVVNYAGNKEAASEVVAKIQDRGGEAVAVQADLGEVSEVRALFEEAVSRFGQLDVLVNNAGIIFPEPIAEATEENYEKTFAVNVRGVFFAMQEAAKSMADGGRIINITSVNTLLPMPGAAAYAATKAAVEQFTKVGSKEFGARGITVNAISPGATDTDMIRSNQPPEVLDQLAGMSPLGRMGEPRDIADVVAFFASEESRWITGQNIQVGGGVA